MQTLHPQNRNVWQELAQTVSLQTICDAINEISGSEYGIAVVKKTNGKPNEFHINSETAGYGFVYAFGESEAIH